MMFAAADLSGNAVNEALPGELVAILDEAADTAHIRLDHDGYEGWVDATMLVPFESETSDLVVVPQSVILSGAHDESPHLGTLPLGARVDVIDSEGSFSKIAGGGFVPSWHIGTGADLQASPVGAAMAFLGAPYIWGGRTRGGLDCSGLIQLAFMAAGRKVPRDSAPQSEGIPGDRPEPGSPLSRGDLVFFPGHVGLMMSATHIIHANARAMAVTIDALDQVDAYFSERKGKGLTRIIRPDMDAMEAVA